MGGNRYEESALFEHRFWLQVLGDHSRFIYDSLSPSEAEEIQKAAYFIHTFDELLSRARKELNGSQLHEFTQQAYKYANEIREFKLYIIREHLAGNIKITLPPTFINHMVNEVEEYIRILQNLLVKKLPEAHSLHHHLLWLPDAAGHAGALNDQLDKVEYNLREKSQKFTKNFDELHIKAIELSGYLRTSLSNFPALNRFNNQAEAEIVLFIKFLDIIKKMRLSKEALGILLPLLADHMIREECYYLTKLSEVSKISKPECDPTKPRI